MKNDSWIILADGVPFAPLPAVAKGMGGRVTAVVVGPRERAEAAAALHVDEVLWYAADDTLPAEAWTDEIVRAAEQAQPRLILALNGAASRAIMGRIAGRLGAGVTSAIQSVSVDGESFLVKRLTAEGRAVELLNVTGSIAGTIIDGAEEDTPTGTMAEIKVVAAIPDEQIKQLSTFTESGGVDLASADRVVGVGVGIGSKENIALAEKLAEALHAEVACSLPLCETYRWMEHSRVVGSSTQKISPCIYMTVGISGQPQHMMGVGGAKVIVAINDDAEAPIFSKCTYGIVGDLNKIVPVLTEALSNIQI